MTSQLPVATAPTITVVNVRRLDPTHAPANLVYLGRRHSAGWPQSPLANPFSVRDHGRDGAMTRYITWLADEIETGSTPATLALVALAKRTRKESLQFGCWCYPLDCHCNVLTKVVGWINISCRLLPEHAWMLRYDCDLGVATDARAAWLGRDNTPRPALWDWLRPGRVEPVDLVRAAQRRREQLPF